MTLPRPSELSKLIARDLEALAREVDAKTAEEGYRQLLSGMARLWRYSLGNLQLIKMQRAGCTSVMGRKQWEAAGRKVCEGEKPIIVLAPNFKNLRSRTGVPFLAVEVFDISQTDGATMDIEGELKGTTKLLGAIRAAASRLDIELVEVPAAKWRYPTSKGTASGRRVEVRSGVPGVSLAGTLVHEYAHVLLHTEDDDATHWFMNRHAVVEAEAEGTSYVVMNALGLDHRAPGYIVWMGGRGATILRSMKRINAAARAILYAVEGKKTHMEIPPLFPRARRFREA